MFGNIMDMFSKLQNIQSEFDNLKTRLDSEIFVSESTDGKIKIVLTNLATIKDIQIADDLLQDKEQLEDNLVVTLNKALDKVKAYAVEEAKKTAKANMPDIPGLPF